MSPAATLDHIVVVSPNLKSGVQWVRNTLGVTPELGGKHQEMGTHNCLLRLGEQTYLEIISPDPNAPDPDRPRWFGLDELKRDAHPRLAAWVARTTDISGCVLSSTEPLGEVAPMSRGNLNWLITVTADGALPLDGLAPVLIQWQVKTHPTKAMRDSGCRLIRLELHGPDIERARTMLRSIGYCGDDVELRQSPVGAAARLVAMLHTPGGMAALSSK